MVSRGKLTRLFISTLFTVAFLAVEGQCGPLDHLLTLKPKATVAKQSETVRGLINRLLPKQAHLFEVVIDEHFTSNHLDKFKACFFILLLSSLITITFCFVKHRSKEYLQSTAFE